MNQAGLRGALIVTATLVCAPAAYADEAAGLGVDECVRIAVGANATIEQAQARVHQWEARLAEVESAYWPKLTGMAYLAPMYTVRGDASHYETRWKRLNDWGPYTHLQAVLALPLYSFGRVEAGERAAEGRAAVERARVRETRNAVILEVKRLYYVRLFALSMLPSLRNGASTAKDAVGYAEKAFSAGTGEATQTDVAKLLYAQSEVDKYLIIAESGSRVATSALKHAMGVPEDADLRFASEILPDLPREPDIELAKAIATASQQRPEWNEIEQGKAAALALEQAEKLADAPSLFAAGMLSVDWAPTRDPANNPYLSSPYNGVSGGVALGLNFDIDPALHQAKAKNAHAVGEEVDALARFAKTGIPMQVKKSYEEVAQYRALVDVSDRGVNATKRWLTFASAAYTTGIGEARDVLEGLASYLQARRGYFENVQNYFVARAELDYAMGVAP